MNHPPANTNGPRERWSDPMHPAIFWLIFGILAAGCVTAIALHRDPAKAAFSVERLSPPPPVPPAAAP
jgi:hypothetical protein